MKSIRGILLSLLLLLALTACAGAGERTAEPEETEEEETVKIREIRKICTTASPAPELSLKGVGESVRAARTVRSVTLSGYPEKMIGGNIENWALSALNDNRSIVDQIAIAGGAGTLRDHIGDAFSQIADGISAWSVSETRGWDGGRSVSVTSKKTGVYGDIDLRISEITGVRMDWRGAKEIWFYADLTDYGPFGAQIGFAFQECEPRADGAPSDVRESWGLRVGSSVSVRNLADGDEWESARVTASSSTTWNGGRVRLPAGFRGWVAIPLERKNLINYWTSGGGDGELNLIRIDQLQLCAEGNPGSTGRTLYLSGYGVAGDGFEGELPVERSGSPGAWTAILPLDSLLAGEGASYSGSLMPWYDEFPGKLLTGIAENYALMPSQELKRAGDELADALRDAQQEDGYLGIYRDAGRFGGNGSNWDVWGHYHSIYGLLSWYRAAGNRDALDTAIRAAECVRTHFADRTYDSAGSQTMNLAVSHAFAELWKETGERKYLDEAVRIVEEDWPRSGNWLNGALGGSEFYQSPLPRWEALHTIMTLGTLWEATGEGKYYTALEDIWWSIAKTDRHNDGGFTSGEAACGDPYNRGAIETCCTVAWMALTTEYLSMSKNPVAADELELSYYNAMFGSLLDGERYVTYNTPMEGVKRVPSQTDISFQYFSGSPDFNCCQANVSRGLGELSRWAAMTSGEELFLNWYGEGTVEALTPGGQAVLLKEETAYPLDGEILLTVDGLAKDETFTLCLRIPSWAVGSAVSVDGRTETADAGTYYAVRRVWKNGDTVRFSVEMSYHVWANERHPGEISVYYGPILLAAKGKLSADLSYKDFADTTVRYADDGEHWMEFEVGEGENRTLFCDFASVGKFDSYTTWFSLRNTPARIAAQKGGAPIWCNTILH
ncbi:MAG: glycoside hydrolase family 127 protein [Clostridia bacterium]|nr:glycoside hydrolase family 127 protein [Clostridia bacterium]